MFFNPKALLLGATALFFSGLVSAQNGTAQEGSCDGGPWKTPIYTGAEAGTAFCHTKYQDGVVMSGIEVWSAKKNIEAIQFYYSDGSNSGTIGKIDKEKEHMRLDWDPASDGLSQVKMWADKKGESLGRIYLRTKNGQELNLGKEGDTDPVETQVQSGMLLGASGRADGMVNGLSLLFLGSKVDKITLSDVVFDETPEELNKRMQGLQMTILDYADHTNAMQDSNETFTFGKTETRTQSKEYSTTQTHTLGFTHSVEISGKLMGIGMSASNELSYSYANAKTETSSTQTTVSLNYVSATMLKPGQRVFCRATAMFGQYKGDYTSTMNVELEDGTVWKFRADGTMEQIAWSQASSKCQSDPFPADAAVPAPGGSAPPSNSTAPAARRALPFLA
ncbi:hypothetical protein K458DRAFT_436110 [Lentithecium fluviatile CBS 122367]|uniref:Jacalin-type lectin domain-containing protein n=1 Tax=Lentithecium fluviatile CBS 122367 TaxID=1168545 RepID=A0A6G1IJU1_9PLEO|nr:hypothetical protein K458DRAFT_436110 [Lentithecium fluviatile CBS 122367]